MTRRGASPFALIRALSLFVVPAQAGTQRDTRHITKNEARLAVKLDSHLRGNDERGAAGMTGEGARE